MSFEFDEIYSNVTILSKFSRELRRVKKKKRKRKNDQKRKYSLVDVSAVPAFLGVARRHDEAVVANLVRQINPKLPRISYSLPRLFHQFVENGSGRDAIVRQRVLIEIQRFQFQFPIVPTSAPAQHGPTTACEHPLRDVVTVLLKVHDRLRDFQVERPYQHLDVERTQQPVGHFVHGL